MTPRRNWWKTVVGVALTAVMLFPVYWLGTVALTLLVAAPGGYSLAKLRPRGGGVLGFVLLIAQMIPAIIMAMGFYAAYLKLGVLNTLGGLVVADSTIAVPFGILIGGCPPRLRGRTPAIGCRTRAGRTRWRRSLRSRWDLPWS